MGHILKIFFVYYTDTNANETELSTSSPRDLDGTFNLSKLIITIMIENVNIAQNFVMLWLT